MKQHLAIWILCSGLGVLMFLGCNEPTEQAPPPTQQLPPEKEVLSAYHPEEFLTTEIVSAPILSQENHPHGWQQANCTRCHRSPAASLAPEACVKCHGRNGVGGHEDTCANCHRVTNPYGAPATGQHLAHVNSGPRDQACIECHPGPPSQSNVHANGITNIRFQDGGTYVQASDETLGTCTTTCHEPREWGGEGCDVCHGNPPETGEHPVHLSETDITCRDCHQGNQHDDNKNAGLIEVGGIEYDPITGECASSCHEETQVWGCTDCHGYPPTSGNHARLTHDFDCERCHLDHDHSYLAATQPLDMSNVVVNLADQGQYRDETMDGMANGTCSGTGCHGPRDWGTDCSQCHEHPPTSAYHFVHVVEQSNQCIDCHEGNQHDLDNTSGSIDIGGITYSKNSGGCVSECHEPKQWECRACHGYPPETANHPAHQQEAINCQECHVDHDHSYKMALTPFDVTEVSVGFAQGGDYDDASGLCSTPCHEPRVWGSSCADCHGNPPATGSHLIHTRVGSDCDDCHKGRDHDLDRTSGVIDIGGIEYNSFTGDCASSCHSGQVRWGCGSCHGYPPETGAHREHAVELNLGCHLCHQGHEHSYRAADPVQQEFEPVDVGFTIRGSWDGQTCANIGCHGDRPWGE